MIAHRDLTRILFAISAILLLGAAAVWVMWPFLAAIIWAGMVVIATWPLLIAVETKLRGRRGLATAVMLLGMLVVLVLPVWQMASTLVAQSGQIVQWGQDLADAQLPPPPAWVAGVPVVGEQAASLWRDAAEGEFAQIKPHLAKLTSGAGKWAVAQAGTLGLALLHLALTMILAAVFFLHGEATAAGVLAFMRRLAGEQGEAAARLAAQAVRGVAIGLVVTAVVQSLMGGIALVIAGVPFAALLTAVMFMLTLAQIGPLVVLIPATIWLFYTGDTGWGLFLGICSVVIGTIDNFLRPWLIRRGADLPLLLVFAGVMGGLFAFGLIGLFIGPVVLAVAWTLIVAWVREPETLAVPVPELPAPARQMEREPLPHDEGDQ